MNWNQGWNYLLLMRCPHQPKWLDEGLVKIQICVRANKAWGQLEFHVFNFPGSQPTNPLSLLVCIISIIYVFASISRSVWFCMLNWVISLGYPSVTNSRGIPRYHPVACWRLTGYDLPINHGPISSTMVDSAFYTHPQPRPWESLVCENELLSTMVSMVNNNQLIGLIMVN